MRRFAIIVIWALAAAAAAPASPPTSPQPQDQKVVDRIAAHIEGDIILESEVRELGEFQKLVEGRAESDDRLLEELIEQWVVQSEATNTHFPQPAQSEIDRELLRLEGQFANPQAYATKLRELGLSPAEVRDLLARQILVERYLDYKFRPTVQIEPNDIDAYYQKELLPELAANNQPAPHLIDVQEQIRELLTQRGISDLAAKWLDDTKSRLKIELAAPDGNTDVKPDVR